MQRRPARQQSRQLLTDTTQTRHQRRRTQPQHAGVEQPRHARAEIQHTRMQRAGVENTRTPTQQRRRSLIPATRHHRADIPKPRHPTRTGVEIARNRSRQHLHGLGGLVKPARGVRADVPESRHPAGAGVKEARGRGGGRIPEPRRRRNVAAHDVDGPDAADGVQVQGDVVDGDCRGAQGVDVANHVDRQRKWLLGNRESRNGEGLGACRYAKSQGERPPGGNAEANREKGEGWGGITEGYWDGKPGIDMYWADQGCGNGGRAEGDLLDLGNCYGRDGPGQRDGLVEVLCRPQGDGIDFDGADRNIGYADAERDCRDVDGRDDQGSEVEGFVDVDRDVGKYVDGLDSDGADTTVYVQAEGNDRKNVRSRGEAEQALVVAPPQDAVAVVTGDEGTGVDVAGVGHPGVDVTGVQPTRVDTARVETAGIGLPRVETAGVVATRIDHTRIEPTRVEQPRAGNPRITDPGVIAPRIEHPPVPGAGVKEPHITGPRIKQPHIPAAGIETTEPGQIITGQPNTEIPTAGVSEPNIAHTHIRQTEIVAAGITKPDITQTHQTRR
ncbi:Uncharacterised protein [Mycobacterium tuberculosis]|nr:Uncharacterised protein [Mycobacterium tuberculosis]